MAEKKGAGKAKAGAASKAAKAPTALNTVPEWASTTAVAKLLGKTTRRIQQLTQDGVLETEVPPGGGARKYKTCETIQRYIAHIEQKAQETAAASSTAELNLRKLEAEVELKESQGQLHKLKTAIAEGKYIKAEEATRDLADFMAMFKKFAMNIPPRTVKSIAGYADPQTARAMEKAMRKELEDMLAYSLTRRRSDRRRRSHEAVQGKAVHGAAVDPPGAPVPAASGTPAGFQMGGEMAGPA